MPRSPRLLAILCLAPLLVACSSTRGKLYQKSDLPALELGTTRRGEISSKIGDPTMVGFVMKNDFQYVTYSYNYSEATSAGVRSRQFRAGFGPDDKVAFYLFQSNFPDDTTDFDITHLSRIAPGKTTTADIRKELGEPHGRDVTYIGDRRYRTWIYAVTRLENADQPILKRAALHFDTAGVLVWYEAQGDGFLLP